ncbi:response regulator transcription factor [Virgibacillus sp. MSJ-26]|uniref:response regulator transcription factor n=1 Tax=Virgibacillus sp. MSJ-26 TaxID=2841522 RepID=UPI001C0FC662|nr:response regulator transcription factor [Virgibacillus sp. MSJ-26]MBU5468090.1 response regulator transcription factor [Virgibacillus sp. MSJ-26]
MKQKILIVDDEEPIVTLLTFNIQRAGYMTEVSYNGKDAINKAMSHDFHLIILDLMLPEINGMEVCRYLREHDVDTPILMLTAKDNEMDKVKGLEVGADDYLTKPFSPKEVIARINAILRRVELSRTLEHTKIKIGDLVIYPDSNEVTIQHQKLTFTRKEFELLLYLVTHKGKVLSRNQLLKDVWDYDFVGDTRIVDVHIGRLREKIEPSTKKPTYIITIRGLGYKMEDPEKI